MDDGEADDDDVGGNVNVARFVVDLLDLWMDFFLFENENFYITLNKLKKKFWF